MKEVTTGAHGFKPPISRQNPNYQAQKKKKNSHQVSKKRVIEAYQDFSQKRRRATK
tara:strand:- start:4974 stop:5141 length:168 start_codon:yes stop_codon:yes gene_type:complete